MFTAVLFDLDGTLVHTKDEYRYKIVGGVLDKLGIRGKLRESKFKKFVDKFWFEEGRDQTIEDFLGVHANEFWKIFRELDTPKKRARALKVYEDVDFLDKLKSSGFKIAIVTGAPPMIAELELELLGKHKFDQIIIANPLSGIEPKPDPRGILLALERLQASPRNSVYVGNSEGDLMAAKKIGVYDVFVDRGEYPIKFTKVKPSLKIRTLYELSDLLKI
ncbi:hypothetical protein DRN63_02245 [Nanoarchaeota archaeon]|nr:MAG: hypothetical protein DRN63_02245 [Nanoarchaeota archaeon]